MNPNYNQSYSKEQINAVLGKIKDCVVNNKYTIALNNNRQENMEFISEYNFRSERQKSILLSLKTEDFCYTLQNTKRGSLCFCTAGSII